MSGDVVDIEAIRDARKRCTEAAAVAEIVNAIRGEHGHEILGAMLAHIIHEKAPAVAQVRAGKGCYVRLRASDCYLVVQILRVVDEDTESCELVAEALVNSTELSHLELGIEMARGFAEIVHKRRERGDG